MPCVFPVLSLKALSLAAPGHGNREKLRREGLAFGAGVIATFLALAGLLLALRAAGEQFGWGFQLQSPAMVTALALLFFVLALNLSGVFEFTALVPSSAGDWNAEEPLRQRRPVGRARGGDRFAVHRAVHGRGAGLRARATGGPDAGRVPGARARHGAAVLPAVLVPGLARLLPKPGVWMERLKQFLAFPLYATVAWLVWVLGAQVDNDAVVRLLVTLLVIAFALWAWRTYRLGAARGFSVVALAGLLAAAMVAWPLFSGAAAVPPPRRAPPRRAPTLAAVHAGAVSELIAGNKAVFVDFTAAWCVTCQVNKRLVLNDGAVKDAFAKGDVELVRADWTRRDPQISQALAALGRQGVPVYVLYRPARSRCCCRRCCRSRRCSTPSPVLRRYPYPRRDEVAIDEPVAAHPCRFPRLRRRRRTRAHCGHRDGLPAVRLQRQVLDAGSPLLPGRRRCGMRHARPPLPLPR